MPADPTKRRPFLRNRWFSLGLVAVVVALLAGGAYGFAYLFLRPEAPAAVGLSSASPTATAATETSEPSSAPVASASSSATGSGLDGTWNVDPAVGSFSDFSGSFVGYRVDEELASVGAATAVGRTPDVTGTLTVDG